MDIIKLRFTVVFNTLYALNVFKYMYSLYTYCMYSTYSTFLLLLDYPFILILLLYTDELLTLMGTGALVEDELEELLSITSRNRSEDMPSSRLGREGRPMGMYSDPLVAQEIRSWVTLADRAATGNGAAPSSSSGHASSSGSSKNKSSSSRKEQSSGASMYFINKSCWRCNDVSLHTVPSS